MFVLQKAIGHTKHYYSIDAVRIIAAFLVLLNHFAVFKLADHDSAQHSERAFPFLDGFAGLGAVGVEIFFVVSGFVIASCAARGTGPAAALQFIRSRARRILPALWISGLIAVLARSSIGEPLPQLLAAFFRSSVLSPFGPYIDGVVWSLVVEAFFYIVVAATMMRAFRDRLGMLALVMGAFSFAYIALFVALSVLGGEQASALIAILERFPFKIFLARYGVFFAIGMLIWSGLPRMTAGNVAFVSLCGLACCCEILISIDGSWSSRWMAVAVWVGAVCVMVACKAGVLTSEARCSTMSKRVTRFLGELSYPLYLNHYAIGIVITHHLAAVSSPSLRFLLALAAVVLLSVVVLRLEIATRRWLSGRAEVALSPVQVGSGSAMFAPPRRMRARSKRSPVRGSSGRPTTPAS